MTDKTAQIKEALAKLDVKDDDQWTGDGLPRIDVMNKLVKGGNLTRAEITKADPSFNREKNKDEAAKAAEAPIDDAQKGETPEPVNDPNVALNQDHPVGVDAAGVVTTPAVQSPEGAAYVANTDDKPVPEAALGEPDPHVGEPAEDLRGVISDGVGGELASDEELEELDEAEVDEADAEIADLEKQIAKAEDEVREADAAHAKAVEALQRVQANRDRLVTMRDQRHKPRPHDAVAALFARQDEEATRRAETASNLRSLGITAQDLAGKGPLDQAMARKNTRGTQRPNLNAPVRKSE